MFNFVHYNILIVRQMFIRQLFRMSQAKIPKIEDVKQQWNEFSSKYNTFDLGPQTFFFSLVNILNLHSASNILEVACGTGKLLAYALEKKSPNASYLASDLSPNMVSLAQQNLKNSFSKYQSKLTFEEWCRIQKIKFDVINAEEPFDNKELFDRIICNCALMLTQNPEKMLTNLSNLSKKGCLLGLSVWGNRAENNYHLAIMESILQNGFELLDERSKFHLYKKVEPLAEKAGWEVILNWQQNTLFPVLEYSPDKNTQLFHFQINKLPANIRDKVKPTLEKKLAKIFAQKKGANFSCQMYVLRKK